MTEQCCNGTCRRKSPIRVLGSDLTGRFYALTRWKSRPDGWIESTEKHDVTADVEALLKVARHDERERIAKMLETLEYAKGGTLQPTSVITVAAAAQHVREMSEDD